MRRLAIIAALLAGVMPAVARAQAESCLIPAKLPTPSLEGATRGDPKRIVPIGGYSLALSWSPNYCHGKEDSADDAFQCSPADDQRFGFVLHGLWPEGQSAAPPQFCKVAALVPRAVIRATLCTTPSIQLIQHEWSKHGICMAPTAKAYFATGRRLFQAVRFPDMAALARRRGLRVGDVIDGFTGANRALPAEAIRISVARSGFLSEVALCLDKTMKYARCPNAGAPRTLALKITDPG